MLAIRRVTVVTYHHTHLREPHWTASLGHYPIGFGMTEAEAVTALFTQLNEREEAEEFAEFGKAP